MFLVTSSKGTDHLSDARTCSNRTGPCLRIAPSQYMLADDTPMLRDGLTGDWIGSFKGHKVAVVVMHASLNSRQGAVWGVSIDKQALRVATASADYFACVVIAAQLHVSNARSKVWDAVSGAELHTFSHPKVVRSIAFDNVRTCYADALKHCSQSGTRIATGCNDKSLRIFTLDRPDHGFSARPKYFVFTLAVPAPLLGHTSDIKKVLWARDDATFITVSEDKSIRCVLPEHSPPRARAAGGTCGLGRPCSV